MNCAHVPRRRPWWRRLSTRFTLGTGLLALVATALVAAGSAPADAASWSPKPAPMTTPWTAQVPDGRQVVEVDTARVKAANQALISASRTTSPPVTLPTGQYTSLRVTTPGYTDRYLRHYDGPAFTAVVNGGSDALLRSDATWKIVTGLANGNCYSFESRNYPGEFLRHRDFRVRRDANDGSALFKADATWCPVARSGGVRLTSANLPGSYLRHIDSEVWLATPGGGHTWDNPATFTEDTTWAVDAPWAP